MYEKVRCPACKTLNLVYLGDWTDDTSPDVEAAKCGKCDTAFLMGDSSNQRETLDIIILSHCEEDEDEDREHFLDVTRPQMVNDLLAGKGWKGQSLSDFLKENAYTETGEVNG